MKSNDPAVGSANGVRHNVQTLATDVLIVGGGFGGMYGMHQFRKMGLSVKLFEAGSDFGGTWHWNRYPGARVDSDVPYYSLSIPEVWKDWIWKERFPGHVELREYFRHVDETLGLSKDTYFNTIVVEATHNGDHWVVKTNDGIVAKCTYLVLATGSSYKQHYPDFKGLHDYKGTIFHSSNFPEDLEIRGKRIGIVGNGATGVQIVQELAKEDCELTVFIRTPNIALPMVQREMSQEEQIQAKKDYVPFFAETKKTRAGFLFEYPSKSFWDSTPEEREAVFEKAWATGGFAFNQATWRDFILDKKANKIFYDFWKEKVRARISDRSKADIVAPLIQTQIFGTKRPSLEQNYYEMLDRKNVEVVDIGKYPIDEFQKDGIRTSEKLHELDIIVLATGFDSVTGSLTSMGLKDKDGITLLEKWKGGVHTYLGLTIDGMPNMFMVYSPQAPTAFSNGPPIIEVQIDWIAAAIEKMQKEGIKSIDARPEYAAKWRQDIQDMNNQTLFRDSTSWYMGSNIPGKVREQLLYLGGIKMYAEAADDALDGWKGFDVVTI